MATLPDDNLGYATLLSVDSGKSYGSGFRMKYDSKNYLITAKHVLYTDDRLHCEYLAVTCQTGVGQTAQPLILEIDMKKAVVKFAKDDDVAVVLLGENQKLYDHTVPLKEDKTPNKRPARLVVADYVTIAQQGNANIVSLEIEATRPLDKIRIGNDAYVMGYPLSLAMKNEKFFDYSKPLLRKGIIAGTYFDENTFIIDCPTYYGNSGGPIIEFCEDGFFRVIGLVSRFIPFQTEWMNMQHRIKNTEITNSGYTICVPMNAIEAVLKQ